ncbi:MAG: biotin transporter BioY [Oscillospiraceae bacterium]|jgi:biotin transport system substrate-specific component
MNSFTRVRFSAAEMALVSIFAALTAGLTQIIVPLPAVPISLGNFAVMLCAAVLPLKLAFAAQTVYLLLGAFGAPVFTYFSGGFHKLAGPTGGYLVGYLALVLVVGLLRGRYPHVGLFGLCLMMIGGMTLCLALGTLWLAVGLGYSAKQAFLVGVAPFLVFDLVKAIAASVIGLRLRSTLSRAGLGHHL